MRSVFWSWSKVDIFWFCSSSPLPFEYFYNGLNDLLFLASRSWIDFKLTSDLWWNHMQAHITSRSCSLKSWLNHKLTPGRYFFFNFGPWTMSNLITARLIWLIPQLGPYFCFVWASQVPPLFWYDPKNWKKVNLFLPFRFQSSSNMHE